MASDAVITVWKLNLGLAKTLDVVNALIGSRGCDRLLLALRLERSTGSKWRPISAAAEATLELRLRPFQVRCFLASSWPGTQLIGHPGRVYVFQLTERVASIVGDLGESLSSWRHDSQPSLPEDICIFRSGENYPNLVTVTHEQDGWLIGNGKAMQACAARYCGEPIVVDTRRLYYGGVDFCVPFTSKKLRSRS